MKPDVSVMRADRLLDAFIEALAEPAVATTADLRVVALNGPAQELSVGLRPGGALALGLRAPEILDAARRVAAGSGAEHVVWSQSVPAPRLFDVRIAAIEADGVRRLLVTLRDMSESRRIERMRADFIANASHELRTPLASILGFVETLQHAARDDPAARERFLAIMREQGRRMARLIDDLLSLSRIEQNLHVRPQQEVDLGLVVRHVCDTFGPAAREAGVRLNLAVPERAIVAGDRDELVRIVENLVENAIKYGSGGGEQQIDVIIAHEDQPSGGDYDVGGAEPAGVEKAGLEKAGLEKAGAWRLDVRDYGPGIAAEHLPRLTERFYRVDAPASRAKGGTGLGLAIVKHIVARHRGRFLIESRLGEGAKFSIVLPPAPSRAANASS